MNINIFTARHITAAPNTGPVISQGTLKTQFAIP
jgi:hypothetical protein